MVRLTVCDQGEGIAAEHLPRLTERFYRVDSVRSRTMGGTGLGLAIVKHIVERHRGQLEISSTLGEGTCISLTLPQAMVPTSRCASVVTSFLADCHKTVTKSSYGTHLRALPRGMLCRSMSLDKARSLLPARCFGAVAGARAARRLQR